MAYATMVNDGGSGGSMIDKSKSLLYIGAFLGSVILMNMLAGEKATYYYLLLVLIGVAMENTGKYNINITTPEILRGGSTGTSRSW